MRVSKIHEERMLSLLAFLEKNYNPSEVPIASSIYSEKGDLLSVSLNAVEENKDSTSHAEILAIQRASQLIKNPNLKSASIYSTLEPCLMCLGAVQQSNLSQVIFGAFSNQISNQESYLDLFRQRFPKTEIIGGVFEKECKEILESWFKSLRR